MNPEQWLSLKWNGGSTMSDRWLNQSKIIQFQNFIDGFLWEASQKAAFPEYPPEILLLCSHLAA